VANFGVTTVSFLRSGYAWQDGKGRSSTEGSGPIGEIFSSSSAGVETDAVRTRRSLNASLTRLGNSSDSIDVRYTRSLLSSHNRKRVTLIPDTKAPSQTTMVKQAPKNLEKSGGK